MAKGDKLARGRITIVNMNDGADVVVLYTRSQFQPSTPTGNTPAGWSAVASTFDNNYWTLWASSAKRLSNGTIEGAWSAPIPAELYDSNALGRFPFVEGIGNQLPYVPYSSTDNKRELGLNPFGVSEVLWRGKSQISTGWCGGLSLSSSSYVPHDNTKAYRYACWFKRNTWSEGGLYFGIQGVIQAGASWADNSNYYFWNTGTTTVLQANKWYLAVGYLYPSTHTDATVDIRSGVYDAQTGLKVLTTAFFARQKAGVTNYGIRIAQYNCPTTNPEVDFWQPRIDLCDGREPSIEELLKKNPLAPTVSITGESVFKFLPGQSVPTKTSIAFSATLNNGLTNYQWQYSNGGAWTNISGATAANYSLAYNYSAWGSNAAIRVRCISTMAGIIYFSNEITITKIYDGAVGPPGVDANLLDWVADWDSAKTVIGANSVITPKIFAGVKNSNNTVTGIALGRFSMSARNDAGAIVTETIDGIYGFRDGYKTFYVDSGGNAGLGRGNQSIKYNAVTGKIEFGSEVAMAWVGATYIDANGIFTGTLSANTVNAININASQITAGTIDASRINTEALKATLITAGNINALTLSVTKGTIGGWSIDADAIFREAKNNTSGAYTAASGAMTIGSTGIRGFKWRLDSTGAGAVAGGNIAWDASGNVTFASSVSLNWTTPINNITTALGGSAYPKLTQINAAGIYTGSITASQITAGTISADRIAAGSIDSTKLNAESIKANIINVGYINGLTCSFVRGTIGGWTINSGTLATSQIVLDSTNKRIAVYGASSSSTSGQRVQLYYSSDTNFGFYATDTAGSVVVRLGSANQIAGWNITSTQISKNSVVLGADGSIYNGTKWKLNNDGSGQIANGNISWNASGAVTFAASVSLNWISAIEQVQNNLTDATDGAKTTIIDLTASTYSQNTYYPVILALGTLKRATILLYNSLGASGIPTWATHGNGFSCECEWVALGHGWGTTSIGRSILRSSYTWTNITPFGDIDQMTNSNFEVIYIRGGGKYYFKTTNVTTVEVKTQSFTSNGQTIAPKTAVIQPQTDITKINNALGGTSYPKLTHITSTGIYTGTLTATQVNAVDINANSITAGVLSVDRLASGSITAVKLDAASIKANIINTDYINGLSCTFVRGQIGGFTIGSDNMSVGSLGAVGSTPIQIRSTNSGSGAVYAGAYKPFGITMTWHQSDNAGHLVLGQVMASGSSVKTGFVGLQMMSHDNLEYFCLSTNYTRSGSKEVYNRIAGWGFDNANIWKNSVYLGSDGSIYNGTKWRLNNDGSGQIANGNISWNSSGTVTFASSVSLNWTTPINNLTNALGGSSYPKLTQITSTGIYTGTLNATQITAGTISAARIDTNSIKTAILTADNINALTLNTTKGMIGGWSITSTQIAKNSVALSSDGSIVNGSRWRLNNDGSGQLANGNITWDTLGNVTARGAVFNNVRIQGSVRNPFVLNDSSIWIGGDTLNQQNFNNYDNIVAVRGSWDEDISLPWTLANSGRRVTLVNYKWGSNTTVGYMTIYAPSGKYFFEDGIQKTSITFSRELVELLGYGDSSTFFGWIVINRRDIMTSGKYGSFLQCLAGGMVTVSGTSASIKQKTFDGTKMTVSRTGVGRYTIYLPWPLSGNYIVQMTGHYINTPIYATIMGIYNSYFTVQTQDDPTANEGSFCFQVFSTADWS